MIEKNPYEPTTSTTNRFPPQQTKRSVLMFAISLNFLALAGFMFLCSESWTMYTPYSTENLWRISLQGLFEFSISAAVGLTILATLLLMGTLFLWLAIVACWKSRQAVAVAVNQTDKSRGVDVE